MHTLDDLKNKEGLEVTVAEKHYESDDDIFDNEKGPLFTSYWVKGEGLQTMVNWPPQSDDDQVSIDLLINPPPVEVVKETESIADLIDEAENIDDLKEALKKILV